MYSYFLHPKCFYDHLQGCKRLSRAIYLWNSCTLCVFLLPNRSTHTNTHLKTHKTHTQSNAYTQTYTITHQPPQPQRQIIGKVCLFVHICTTETNIFMCGICRVEFLWICIFICKQTVDRKQWIKRHTST